MSALKSIYNRDWRGFALPLALLAVWYVATVLEWVNIKLIVPPQAVIEAGSKFISGNDFWSDVGHSLYRDLTGLLLGSAGGIALGLTLGLSRWARHAVSPTFNTLTHISLFAWLPLLSTWLGTGDAAKIVFISLCAFFPVALNTYEGIRGIPRAQLEVAKVYAFTRWQSVTRLILPGASPQILVGFHLALVYAWMGTIGAEFLLINADPGLGLTVIRGRLAFNVGLIIFGMLAIGFIGTLFNQLGKRIEARLLGWRGDAT